ncbi:MAG: C10 family peptidase [Bacteroidaceae bacterium]|nr:C10 family peptidase [Bacteroidaceae bacterium]
MRWYSKVAVTLLLMLATMMAWAEPVSESEAREKAAQFLLSLRGNASSVRNAQRLGGSEGFGATLRAVEVQKDYYVFNIESDGGYVIVSGDDCVGDNLVLGYATQGGFNAERIPDNLKWWLDTTAEGIAHLRALGVKATSVPLHEDIAPMVTAKWDQRYPYNITCPMKGEKQTLCGCMATALAQVMYYHRWPQAPIAGELPSYTMADGTVIPALEPVAFDWENMTDHYDESSTEEQMLPVATLMRYCGQSVQMDYAPEVSNGVLYDLDLLVNSFGYDPGVYCVQSDDYTVSGWDALLYSELSEGRPLVFAGHSMIGGHAFVIDGYKVQNGEGYFSVNWGWAGGYDGFYKLNLLNPPASGNSNTKDGYTLRQIALIGLKPCLAPPAKYYRQLYSSEWNHKTEKGPEISMANLSYRPGTFDIALVSRNSDGTPDYYSVVFQNKVTVPGFSVASLLSGGFVGFYQLVLTEEVCNDMFKNLAPGRYDLMFVGREDVEGAPWQPVFGSNSYIEVVVGEAGKMTELILHPHPQLSLIDSDIHVEGLKQWGIRQEVTASFHNASADDYMGSVNCGLYRIEDGVLTDKIFENPTGIMIEANVSADIDFCFSAPKDGEYVLLLTKVGNEDVKDMALADIMQLSDYLGHKLITFDNLGFVCRGVEYSETNKDDKTVGVFKYSLENGTPLDYDAAIEFIFYRRNDSGEEEVVMFQGIPFFYENIWVSSNNSLDHTITLPEPLAPGVYDIKMYIACDFYSLFMSDYFVFDTKTLTIGDETIIDNGQLTMDNDGEWYTIDGRKLDGKPTVKGIYIANGRKLSIEN